MNQTKKLKIKSITIDAGTQQRTVINPALVDEYHAVLESGKELPPITVFSDGAKHYLADGFHRYHANRKMGYLDIESNIVTGTLREAILFSLSANATHGQRLTNADKRKAVATMLQDAEWAKWSDRAIAEHCHVTHPFVAKMREELNPKEVVTVTTTQKKQQKKQEDANPVVTVTTPKEPEYNHESDKQNELAHAVEELAAENEALKDQVAAGVMPGTEEDRKAALDTMQSLRQEVKTLTASLKAMTKSRDDLMRENAQMKKQIVMLQKKRT